MSKANDDFDADERQSLLTAARVPLGDLSASVNSTGKQEASAWLGPPPLATPLDLCDNPPAAKGMYRDGDISEIHAASVPPLSIVVLESDEVGTRFSLRYYSPLGPPLSRPPDGSPDPSAQLFLMAVQVKIV